MKFSNLTVELIDIYLRMIGADHHKQCDGYFSINLTYCGYHPEGKEYSWEAVHAGYLHKGEFFAESFDGAEVGLQKMVCDFIDDQIKTYNRCLKEPNEWDICFPSDMVELIQAYQEKKSKIND